MFWSTAPRAGKAEGGAQTTPSGPLCLSRHFPGGPGLQPQVQQLQWRGSLSFLIFQQNPRIESHWPGSRAHPWANQDQEAGIGWLAGSESRAHLWAGWCQLRKNSESVRWRLWVESRWGRWEGGVDAGSVKHAFLRLPVVTPMDTS